VPPSRLRIVARVGPPASPLHRFLFGSGLVHLLLVVLVVLLPRLGRGSHIPEDALFVELAPAFPSRAPASAPPVQAPEPTPPAEPAEGVRVETSAPKKIEPLKKEEEQKPPAKPPEPRPEPVAPAQAEPGGGAVAESMGGPDAGHSIAPLTGGDLEFAWYRAQVTSALFGNWQRPILTGLSEPIEVTVSFDIARDGRVLNLRVESSSGVPSLDRSALRAVADASPLPPLPASWRESTQPAGFVFRLYPEGP